MMFESNLLSQINVASPLPSFVEVDLVNSINNSLSKSFRFAHVLLAEKSHTIANLLPWSAEIWLVLQSLLEHRLLFHANTTFAEMLFGLRRGVIISPATPLGSQGKLSWWLRGPAPIPSLEERALHSNKMIDSPSDNNNNNNNNMIINNEINDELTAGAVAAAQGASYGHLRFSSLNNMRRYSTLFIITLVPYVKERLAAWYAQETDWSPGAIILREAYALRYPFRARIKNILKQLYPLFRTITESLGLLYKVMFLLELTPYTTPLHRLFGIAQRRLTNADQLAASNPRAQRALMLARVLFYFIFVGFRLLELTQANNNNNNNGSVIGNSAEDLAVPEPPVWGVDVEIPAESKEPQPGVCPVCQHQITNAAVCVVSGVVGCYPCLQNYAREHGACPVTRHKMTVECIRRIYES